MNIYTTDDLPVRNISNRAIRPLPARSPSMNATDTIRPSIEPPRDRYSPETAESSTPSSSATSVSTPARLPSSLSFYQSAPTHASKRMRLSIPDAADISSSGSALTPWVRPRTRVEDLSWPWNPSGRGKPNTPSSARSVSGNSASSILTGASSSTSLTSATSATSATTSTTSLGPVASAINPHASTNMPLRFGNINNFDFTVRVGASNV